MISEAELREGDRPPKPVRCINCKELIPGKVYPGPRCLKCHNEATNPDG